MRKAQHAGIAMHFAEFDWISHDGQRLFARTWQPTSPAHGQLLIIHGMAEHCARYARLAQTLVDNGFGVYAFDQRGHGRTAEAGGVLGHFADQGGWNKAVEDVHHLASHIRQHHPEQPLILLGHSMGTYIGQAYLMRYSHQVQAAILSGSNYQPVRLYQVARLIARLERWRLGPQGRSRLINYLSFGSFNKAFQPSRTEFDWLSRDPAEVDQYVQDPLCGFICTTSLWCDLLQGLSDITPIKQLAQIRADLPVLIIGGECDPVSTGKRLNDLQHALQRAGLQQVALQLYQRARHELFNESNREQVSQDLLQWLKQTLQSIPSDVPKEPA